MPAQWRQDAGDTIDRRLAMRVGRAEALFPHSCPASEFGAGPRSLYTRSQVTAAPSDSSQWVTSHKAIVTWKRCKTFRRCMQIALTLAVTSATYLSWWFIHLPTDDSPILIIPYTASTEAGSVYDENSSSV